MAEHVGGTITPERAGWVLVGGAAAILLLGVLALTYYGAPPADYLGLAVPVFLLGLAGLWRLRRERRGDETRPETTHLVHRSTSTAFWILTTFIVFDASLGLTADVDAAGVYLAASLGALGLGYALERFA